MISFLMPFILFFTVIASVSLGVLAAYVAVFGILSTFGHRAARAGTGPPAAGAGSHAEPRQRRLVHVTPSLVGTAAFGCPSSEARPLSANHSRFQPKISLFQFPNDSNSPRHPAKTS